jgi:hypothetical protein
MHATGARFGSSASVRWRAMSSHGKHQMVETTCPDCGKTRAVRKDRVGIRCRLCNLILQHSLRKLPEGEKRRRKQEARRNLKVEALIHYGIRCVCCDEAHFEFLEIDHVNNDGAQHRRDNNIHGGEAMFRWFRDNGYPPGFQTLCSNCNQSKSRYGYCPHSVYRVNGGLVDGAVES